MKMILWCFMMSLLLLLSARAKNPEEIKAQAFYDNKFDAHCRVLHIPAT